MDSARKNGLWHERVKRLLQGFSIHRAYPQANNGAGTIQQEKIWLLGETQLAFERIVPSIIDIQVNEIDPSCPFCLEPVHDGRQGAAGRSPKCEELNQCRPGGQIYAIGIGRF